MANKKRLVKQTLRFTPADYKIASKVAKLEGLSFNLWAVRALVSTATRKQRKKETIG
jgi:hypothetical protein